MVEHWLQQQAEITVALIVNSLDLYASVWLSERIWKCDHLSPNSDGLFESSFCVIFLNVCTTVPCMTQRDPIRQKWRRVVSVLLTTAVAVDVCGVMRREGKGTGQMIEPHPECSAYPQQQTSQLRLRKNLTVRGVRRDSAAAAVSVIASCGWSRHRSLRWSPRSSRLIALVV